MEKVLDQRTIGGVLEPVFRVYNVRRAVLFGSYAKGIADEKSDVDIFVDSRLRGLKFVGLVENIKQALGGKDVDVIDEAHVESNSDIVSEIEKTGVLIYER